MVTLFISMPIIATGVYLSTQSDTLCLNPLQWPIILLGVVILSISITGCVGAFCRMSWLLILYLIAMPILIILLLSLTSFIYIVTVKSSGDYSDWMKQQVTSSSKWDTIKTCLISSDTCTTTITRFPSLKSGCCKPPTRCGFTFVAPTATATTTMSTVDRDCLLWGNGRMELCYECRSCKAGLLQSVRREWRKADLVLIISSALLFSMYLLSCVAYRRDKTDELFRRYIHGYT